MIVAGEAPLPDVAGVAFRSGEVSPGDVFFCIPGFRYDGHDFAAEAVSRGAGILVVQRPIPGVTVPQVVVADARRALARASNEFFGRPSEHLRLLCITGTNGKTTTTYLCDSILRAAGHVTGLIGTIETRVGEERLKAGRTTPESADLQRLLADMLAGGVSAATMEVSSHAIDLHRVDSLHFAVAAFTNLSQDHLDYHHTVEEYFAVKRRLFTEYDVGSSVINIDDPLGAGMALELSAAGEVVSVGLSPDASVRATGVVTGRDGSRFALRTPAGSCEVSLPLAASYNVSNALVAAGCAFALGVEPAVIAEGLSHAPQVPGRLESVDCGQPFTVFVDYAHTPDGLAEMLRSVKTITAGRVIIVFGAGGDRDHEKRPLMGEAAAAHADHIVLTSDNPRTEDPVGIILQIEDGLRDTGASWEIEIDRRKAIARALELARAGDAVVIAGKGHEDYQIFADRTIHFDDSEIVREELTGSC